MMSQAEALYSLKDQSCKMDWKVGIDSVVGTVQVVWILPLPSYNESTWGIHVGAKFLAAEQQLHNTS